MGVRGLGELLERSPCRLTHPSRSAIALLAAAISRATHARATTRAPFRGPILFSKVSTSASSAAPQSRIRRHRLVFVLMLMCGSVRGASPLRQSPPLSSRNRPLLWSSTFLNPARIDHAEVKTGLSLRHSCLQIARCQRRFSGRQTGSWPEMAFEEIRERVSHPGSAFPGVGGVQAPKTRVGAGFSLRGG